MFKTILANVSWPKVYFFKESAEPTIHVPEEWEGLYFVEAVPVEMLKLIALK